MSISRRLWDWVRCWRLAIVLAEWVLEQRLALASESIRRLVLEKAELEKQVRQDRSQQAAVRAGLKRKVRDMQKSREHYRRRCERLEKA